VWTHKASYQQIFSDRFLMDFQYANVGGGFQLDFPNPEEQFHVQRRLELNGNFWAPANEIAGSGEKSVQATSLLDGQRSLALNDARDRWNSPASYLDPTCTAASCQPEQQYAPESGGSGIDNIFNNARWLFKASGFYATPLWDINVGAFYNARQGYPNPTFVLTPSRPNLAGTASVLLQPMGERRHPAYHNIDIKVEKWVDVGIGRMAVSMEAFNLTDNNVVLGRHRQVNSPVFDNIRAIVAPRVLRFGARVAW
jgi:hypothetical protein